MAKSLLLTFSLFFIGSLMLLMGIKFFVKKSSFHFFKDDENSKEMLKDLKKYNLSNAKMWCLSAIPFFALGIISIFFDSFLISLVSAGISILDVIFLILVSHKISERYFKKKYL